MYWIIKKTTYDSPYFWGPPKSSVYLNILWIVYGKCLYSSLYDDTAHVEALAEKSDKFQ